MPKLDEIYNDRIFMLYYEEVGKFSLISADEERELIRKYKTCPRCNRNIPAKIRLSNCPSCGTIVPASGITGPHFCCPQCSTKTTLYVPPKYCSKCGADRDYESRNRLVEANLKFVMKLASGYSKNPEHIRKLASAGNVGLIIAVDKYNPKRCTRFLTYAASWIRKEMLDELHASGLVRVPSHKQKVFRKEMKQGVHKCQHCGVRITGTETLFARNNPCLPGKTHAYLPIDPAEEAPGAVTLLSNSVAQPLDESCVERLYINDNTAQILRKVLQDLPLRERDKFIFMQYYNIAEAERKSDMKSLLQLSAITGVTPERIRQIKERTAKELRVAFRTVSVKEMSDLCF